MRNDNSIFTDPGAFRCLHCGNLVRRTDSYGVYCTTECASAERETVERVPGAAPLVSHKFVVQEGQENIPPEARLWEDVEYADTLDRARGIRARYEQQPNPIPRTIYRVIRRDICETFMEGET